MTVPSANLYAVLRIDPDGRSYIDSYSGYPGEVFTDRDEATEWVGAHRFEAQRHPGTRWELIRLWMIPTDVEATMAAFQASDVDTRETDSCLSIPKAAA